MKRKIVATGDGSTTIQLVGWEEQYHSMHGAIQESRHVFLKTGLEHWRALHPEQDEVHVLEIGFGTGLNALLTAVHLSEVPMKVYYEGVEAYPVAADEVAQLNYVDQLKRTDFQSFFKEMHDAPWDEETALKTDFYLKKRLERFEELTDNAIHDLVYFDAFGAQVQPELWDAVIFKKMFEALRKEGVLVTYAAKGSVRRAMQEVGFVVSRLPGPPGKREMLRAVKP
ncbi:tRNA (5-methylaminomethyl-2-thiouridine)(34)-methyltransferase MnmD [Flavimarina sp. Hel_I_48]|uniref:tRNA (5-methylaminomethyl-2-thiouridine)(34)-methyltransferase MnmD n=1 Tax=Flavimarina sp. Hel_I_48 TaxID=1392488 RepID=UPI0004DF79E2|nr:tRNA (5-methylaminomethyl-2-thiouridine)(34)-methyltransferase MnmD [Flavimarina sp. Hel_I_48]